MIPTSTVRALAGTALLIAFPVDGLVAETQDQLQDAISQQTKCTGLDIETDGRSDVGVSEFISQGGDAKYTLKMNREILKLLPENDRLSYLDRVMDCIERLNAVDVEVLPEYDGEISFTFPANETFVTFLRENDGRRVSINSVVDASIVVGAVTEYIVKFCQGGDLDGSGGSEAVLDGDVDGRLVQIPVISTEDAEVNAIDDVWQQIGYLDQKFADIMDRDDIQKFGDTGYAAEYVEAVRVFGEDYIDCGPALELNLAGRSLRPSSGGTSVNTMRLKGVFEVETTYQGTNTYHHLDIVSR